MLRTSGYVQNCTIGLQWHLMGTYHYSYYNPETSDGKFSQVECLYLLIQYMYIKSKNMFTLMFEPFFSNRKILNKLYHSDSVHPTQIRVRRPLLDVCRFVITSPLLLTF